MRHKICNILSMFCIFTFYYGGPILITMGDERKLRIQQIVFAREYVVDFNATKAAIRAGYSEKTAQMQGSRLLTNVMVQQKIAEHIKHREVAASLTGELLLNELVNMVQMDPKDLYDSEGNLKPLKDIPEYLRKQIQQIEMGDDGKPKKIKLWSKEKAIEQLGKHLKMFTDRVEHSGKVTLEDMVVGSFDDDKD